MELEQLNEDEQVLFEIVGEALFKEIRSNLGGFQIYIQKNKENVDLKEFKAMVKNGDSKRTICRALNISYSNYNRLMELLLKKP